MRAGTVHGAKGTSQHKTQETVIFEMTISFIYVSSGSGRSGAVRFTLFL
jgi:hypothetical protein